MAHQKEKKRNNIECVLDSKAWKHTDSLYPDFALEDWNIKLSITLDGINSFSNQSLSQSTSLAGNKAFFYYACTSHSWKRECDRRERGHLLSPFSRRALTDLGRGQYSGCF